MNKTITYFIENDDAKRINFELYSEGSVIVDMTESCTDFYDLKDLISQIRFVADGLEKELITITTKK